MSQRVDVTFKITMLTADRERLDMACEQMVELLADAVQLVGFPAVDDIDDICYDIQVTV